jgi:hypothetical protein
LSSFAAQSTAAAEPPSFSFLFNQGKNAANTVVLASILTKGERKSAFLRQVRIILITLRR